jgi:hypothetical protein
MTTFPPNNHFRTTSISRPIQSKSLNSNTIISSIFASLLLDATSQNKQRQEHSISAARKSNHSFPTAETLKKIHKTNGFQALQDHAPASSCSSSEVQAGAD